MEKESCRYYRGTLRILVEDTSTVCLLVILAEYHGVLFAKATLVRHEHLRGSYGMPARI